MTLVMNKKNKNYIYRSTVLLVLACLSRLLFDWPIVALLLLVFSFIWELQSSRLRWKLFNSLLFFSVMIPAYFLLAVWEYLTTLR
jgi:predicted membrane protein